jgi:hypothetical protein
MCYCKFGAEPVAKFKAVAEQEAKSEAGLVANPAGVLIFKFKAELVPKFGAELEVKSEVGLITKFGAELAPVSRAQ